MATCNNTMQRLLDLAFALSAEKDPARLLDQIIVGSMELTNADGGTLYTVSDVDPNELIISVIHNTSLDMHEVPENLPPVRLIDKEGKAAKLVVTNTFNRQVTINIDDVYQCEKYGYDCTDTWRFDEKLEYHSKSFLSVPLKNHEGDMIGVLQLINAQDKDGNLIPFCADHEQLTESIASLAATALTKQILLDCQKELFEATTTMIANAIDRKSPVTGKHCANVPIIAMMMAESVCEANEGAYANISFTEAELYELEIASWLHDCGKITSPEYIIDKATKLHALHDRIELVKTRVREYKQALYIELLKSTHERSELDIARAGKEYDQRCESVELDMAFLESANIGKEHMSDEDKERVRMISMLSWKDINGMTQRLLSDDEVKHLCVTRGTITDEERKIMNDHIVVTTEMLVQLPYPKHLKNVAEIACNHHEHLDGSGYPLGLPAEQISLRARIMCIADIFEALTSADRPYKKGMLLSEAMTILGNMVEKNHLDGDLFRLFIESGTYLEYARKHMASRQIDELNLKELPGLRA